MQNMNRREKKTKSKVSTIIKEITGEKKQKKNEHFNFLLFQVLNPRISILPKTILKHQVTDGPDETLVNRNAPYVKRGEPDKSYDHFTPTARKQAKRNCTPTRTTHITNPTPFSNSTKQNLSHQLLPIFLIKCPTESFPMLQSISSVTGYRAISTLDSPAVAIEENFFIIKMSD